MNNPLEPGAELDGGKYRILRLIGQGGMGSVFEAEHRDTHKRVAIKCLHPTHAADPEVAERLAREAQLTARVRHPNVVDVYDVGRDGSVVYLVMEYLEGEPLSYALARRDLPVHALIALLLAAIRGVAAAHRQGVIHRDLKPDNIFLSCVAAGLPPVPKVLDFGVSKLQIPEAGMRSLTRSGVAIGTPCYMSYEQLAGEVAVDGRTDVYACGVILYEAITGRVPYEANTFTELMLRFNGQPPCPPKELCGELPNSLSRVVMWALARDRNDRIASMDALALELEPFATHAGFERERTRNSSDASAHPFNHSSLQAAEVERPNRTQRRRSPASLVWTAVLLLLAASVALLVQRKPEPEPASVQPISVEPARPEPARPEPAPAAQLVRPLPTAQRIAPQLQRAPAPPVQAPTAPLQLRPAPPPARKQRAQPSRQLDPPRDYGIY